jgi:cytochrome c-type biogenesis protein
MDSIWLAAGSAFWLGVMTSISPCPLATNIAAVSYVGGQAGRRRSVLLSGGLYVAGRTLAYLALGAAAVGSLMSMVAVSSFLQGVFHRALGPLLIALGLLLLGWIRFRLPGLPNTAKLQRLVDRSGVWGAGLLGIVFALAFCPVSAGLFFGGLVPLATNQASPFLLPIAFGVGTAVPVAVFAVLLAVGVSWLGDALDRMQTAEVWVRRATACVILGVGIYETLRSTLYLI